MLESVASTDLREFVENDMKRFEWCPDLESNQGHRDFQFLANLV